MTREDVISWLEYLSDDARSKAEGLVPTNIEIACGMAIDALKAQEPVVPTEPDEDNMRYCGACGSPVGYEVFEAPGIEYVQYSYCPECGREVKWDG